MSSSAIIMMVIGCGLLWGGFIASVSYYFHSSKLRMEGEMDNVENK